MRYAAWITKSTVAVAVVALGVSAGLMPAEAKGPPPGKGGPKWKDTVAPTIYAPTAVTAGTFSSSGAAVSFGVYVSDDKDPAPTLTVSPPSGSQFPVGTTTVTVTAKDATGNTSTKSFGVTVSQVSLPKTYKAYAYDSYGEIYYEWDLTIGADRSISGTGRQTALLVIYDGYDKWVDVLPSELSGEGTVSGTIASDGSFDVESTSNYWYADGSTDESYNLLYFQAAADFSGSVTPTVYADGNLVFSTPFPGLPSPWDTYWGVVQP
jgi:hypothetical protein